MRNRCLKIFLFFVCAFNFNSLALGQIKTEVAGFNLGEMGLYDCAVHFKELDNDYLRYETGDRMHLSGNNIRYAGVIWNSLVLSLLENKLERMQFNYTPEGYSIAHDCFEKLVAAFDNKYSELKTYDSTNVVMYRDQYVSVLLAIDSDKNDVSLTYTYTYKPQIGDGI